MQNIWMKANLDPDFGNPLLIRLAALSRGVQLSLESLPKDLGGLEGNPELHDFVRRLHVLFLEQGATGSTPMMQSIRFRPDHSSV